MKKNFDKNGKFDTPKFPPSEVLKISMATEQENESPNTDIDEIVDIINASPLVFQNFTIPVQIERKFLYPNGLGRVSIGKIVGFDSETKVFDVLVYGKFTQDIKTMIESEEQNPEISVGIIKSNKRPSQITYFNMII
jgi:hypothetical protein